MGTLLKCITSILTCMSLTGCLSYGYQKIEQATHTSTDQIKKIIVPSAPITKFPHVVILEGEKNFYAISAKNELDPQKREIDAVLKNLDLVYLSASGEAITIEHPSLDYYSYSDIDFIYTKYNPDSPELTPQNRLDLIHLGFKEAPDRKGYITTFKVKIKPMEKSQFVHKDTHETTAVNIKVKLILANGDENTWISMLDLITSPIQYAGLMLYCATVYPLLGRSWGGACGYVLP
jgi:hypothetical protein